MTVKPADRFYDGVVCGIVVGTSVILTLFWVSDAVPETSSANVVAILTTCATLGAGYLALSAAQRTIGAQQALADDARSNKLIASKGALPLVLSELYSICEKRTDSIIKGSKLKRSDSVLRQELVSIIRDCIEFSNGTYQDALLEILAIYQIALDRYEALDLSYPIDHVTLYEWDKYERYSACADWISLRALTAALFDFSRTRNNSPLPNRDGVFASTLFGLSNLENDGFLISNDPDFVKYLEGRRNSGKAGFSDPNWRMKEY